MRPETHQYRDLNNDELEEHFSNMLIESWSYSKVTAFARNEKAFEKEYVHNEKGKIGPSGHAGTAYHEAMEAFFKAYQTGEQLSAVELEQIAFEKLDEVAANMWKLGKTTPTVEECKQEASKQATAAIKNFLKELEVYTADLDEILDVEVYCNEFVTINGVDIPLPVHAKIDVIFRRKNGDIVIVDHKLKSKFTDKEDIILSDGVQAITYVNAYEAKTGLTAKEVWFVENKYSQNQKGGAQLERFVIEIDENSRRLYEVMLYEPLRRMIEAVHDPDYIFLINHSDNFADKAELYAFWCRQMIAEVEDFDIDPKKYELIAKRLRKIKDASIKMINPDTIKRFKAQATAFIRYDLNTTDMSSKEKIEHVLRTHKSPVEVEHVIEGYSSDSYLLAPGAGVKIASIRSHALDLAAALNVEKVRIPEALTVYQGKAYLCVEANKKRTGILKYDPSEVEGYRIPIGRDNFGNKVVWDLANQSTPHAVVCGSTGSGKTVLIKTALASVKNMGYKIIILDPKYTQDFEDMQGVELWNEIEFIEERMKDLVREMNDAIANKRKLNVFLVIDELADAINQSKTGKALDYIDHTGSKSKHKSLEQNLQMLLQKGRSANLRVVVGLQRASTKILNGDLKVNLTVQICLRVQKQVDSIVVLDEPGAETLSGNGDGLFKSPEYNETVRFQGYYID